MKREHWLLVLGAVAVVAAIVLTVVLATSGSDEPAAAEGPPASKTTAPPEPLLDPLEFAAEPAWSSQVPSTEGAVVRDGVALVYGAYEASVLDVATGDVRWDYKSYNDATGRGGLKVRKSFRGHPWLVEHRGELAVVTEYYAEESEETLGLAMVSAKDGGLIWRTPLVPKLTGGRDGLMDVWAVDDEIALVHVTPGRDYGGWVPIDELLTVAIDTRTGDVLWQRNRWFPLAVTDDHVLGVTSDETPELLGDVLLTLVEGTVGALDRKTGKPQWDLGDRFTSSQVVLAAGDVAVVRGSTAGKAEMEQVLVAIDDGAELREFGTPNDPYCASDGESLIACSAENFGVETFDLDSGDTTRLERQQGSVRGVWQGRIFLNGITIDRNGTQIDEDLPGLLIAETDDHLLFFTGKGGSGPIVGYRRR